MQRICLKVSNNKERILRKKEIDKALIQTLKNAFQRYEKEELEEGLSHENLVDKVIHDIRKENNVIINKEFLFNYTNIELQIREYLLKNGESWRGTICKDLKLPRTTAYDALKKLLGKNEVIRKNSPGLKKLGGRPRINWDLTKIGKFREETYQEKKEKVLLNE